MVPDLQFTPEIIMGVTQLRRRPQEVFRRAKESAGPILVTEFNRPQGVILSVGMYNRVLRAIQRLREKEAVARALEREDALDSLRVYEREKQAGELQELSSLKEFLTDED